MIFSQRQVMEGECLPWGYGRSYWIPQMAACVCYPVPFNLIVRWARNFYYWLACPKPNFKERYEGLSEQLKTYQDRYWELQSRYATLLELFERQQKMIQDSSDKGSIKE